MRESDFPRGSDGKASAYNVGDLVQYLGWEDLLEKEMATHSSILAWKIPWMEEPGRPQSMGTQRVRHDWVTLLTHSMRESIARYVDKKSGVPEEERKVWGSQEGHRVWSSQGGKKDRLFFFFSLGPELKISQQNNSSCSRICFSLNSVKLKGWSCSVLSNSLWSHGL